MATITLTIPDADMPLVRDAICARCGYQATILQDGQMVPNPESKQNFAKRMVIERFVKRLVKEYKMQLATSSADATATSETNAINIT